VTMRLLFCRPLGPGPPPWPLHLPALWAAGLGTGSLRRLAGRFAGRSGSTRLSSIADPLNGRGGGGAGQVDAGWHSAALTIVWLRCDGSAACFPGGGLLPCDFSAPPPAAGVAAPQPYRKPVGTAASCQLRPVLVRPAFRSRQPGLWQPSDAGLAGAGCLDAGRFTGGRRACPSHLFRGLAGEPGAVHRPGFTDS